MKTKYGLILSMFFAICMSSSSVMAQAKAFHKGALVLSLSGGSTTADYSTGTGGLNPTVRFNEELDGVRDPFIIEYGLTRRWGIGFSSGNDLFTVNAMDYYGFKPSKGQTVDIKTTEFTFDLNYHLYSGRRTDWSVYGSVGAFGVNFKSDFGENKIDYAAKGGIVRMGTKINYYFWKRLGALVMVSTYAGEASPGKGSKLIEGQNYSTRIVGTATEFGLCFRFF